jgi:hypothetical protein
MQPQRDSPLGFILFVIVVSVGFSVNLVKCYFPLKEFMRASSFEEIDAAVNLAEALCLGSTVIAITASSYIILCRVTSYIKSKVSPSSWERIGKLVHTLSIGFL